MVVNKSKCGIRKCKNQAFRMLNLSRVELEAIICDNVKLSIKIKTGGFREWNADDEWVHIKPK